MVTPRTWSQSTVFIGNEIKGLAPTMNGTLGAGTDAAWSASANPEALLANINKLRAGARDNKQRTE